MAESPGGFAGGSSSHDSGGGDHSPQSSMKEQDRFLPIANIGRIMKKALPANGKIAKDAKDTVQECVSEFISFVTSEASDKCQKEKRKTINGDDLLWAMATLGFEEYIAPLKAYLARYRELEGDAKGSARVGDGSSRKEIGTQQPSESQIYYIEGVTMQRKAFYKNKAYRGSIHASKFTNDALLLIILESANFILSLKFAAIYRSKEISTFQPKVEVDSTMGSETFLEVILAILLPPVGVFLRYGCGVEFWIDLLLTLLGYIPGIIYAIYVLVG